MPTPFNHLLIAHELLASPLLAGPVREALAAAQPAFLLGNIAPDVQTISGQTREATHFFPVPIGDAPLAHEKLFAEYPALARAAQLPSAQAVFLAGYLAHLALDYLWVTEIFAPIFGPDQTWETFRERLYLHNVLRAHWDARDLTALPNSTAGLLHAAAPGRWLPFVTDPHLRTWRDRVAEQLSGGASRTIEVFAERMGTDPQAFAALLASPGEMQRRVFARLPAERLDAFRALGLAHTAQIIHAYWEGRL